MKWRLWSRVAKAALVCGVSVSCGGRGGEDRVWRVAVHYDLEELAEPSGLVASRKHDGLFWTINDSGGRTEVLGIDRAGSLRSRVRVRDAENVDWEAITMDDRGRLLICDFGNNGEDRKTFRVYVVKEPSEEDDRHAKVKAEVSFRYPGGDPRSINAEACFWADGQLHVLTKSEDGTDAGLYRLGSLKEGKRQILERIGEYPVGSKVTGADVSGDGLRLAVLSYEYLLVFERSREGVSFFESSPRRVLLEAGQCEAIAWDGDDLLIVNEQGDLHVLKPSQWNELEEYLPSKPEVLTIGYVDARGGGRTEIPLTWSNPGQVAPGTPAPAGLEPARAWIGWGEDGLVLDICWPGQLEDDGVAGMLMIGRGVEYGLSSGEDNVAWILQWRESKKSKGKKRRSPLSVGILGGEARALASPSWIENQPDVRSRCGDGTLVRLRIPRRAIPGWEGHDATVEYAFNLVLVMPEDQGQWSFSGDTSTWCWENVFLWGSVQLSP